MNKNCDICMDLLPLVKDGIASKASEEFVKEHIKSCEVCKKYYESENTNMEINDKKVLKKVKSQMAMFALLIIVCGTFLGVSLNNSENMFYNIMLMPFIGCLGFFTLGKKVFYVPVFVTVVNAIWLIVTELGSAGFPNIYELLIYIITWGVIYLILIIIGIVIGYLFKFAFNKGE